VMIDSAGSDTFEAWPNLATMTFESGNVVHANDFRDVHGIAMNGAMNGGADTADLYGVSGQRDKFESYADRSMAYGSDFYSQAKYFDVVNLNSVHSDGEKAVMIDSAGADTFEARPNLATMTFESGAVVYANDFRDVYGIAMKGGTDTADLYGSSGQQDSFEGRPDESMVYGSDFYSGARYFEIVNLNSVHSDGETALLHDSDASDTFEAWPDLATMTFDSGAIVSANDFRYIHAISKPTHSFPDTAMLHGRNGSPDTFTGTPTEAKMEGSDYLVRAEYFDSVKAEATVGDGDEAYLVGSPDLYDYFIGRLADPYHNNESYANLYGFGFSNEAIYFDKVFADAGSGGIYDRAILSDSADPDTLETGSDWARLSSAATSYLFEVTGFDYVSAESTTLGDDDTVSPGGHLFELDLLNPDWWENKP
ncbi:MAG: hypothetical protein ABIP48_08580, partial [Planctomycetota bacterium]